MKVIEKLFNNYLQTPSDQYVSKYLAAKSILEITEEMNSERINKIILLRNCISEKCPISVFRAEMFLRGKDTTLTVKKTLILSKSRGADYLISEYLGEFLDEINKLVVESLNKYNTDRGRNFNNDDEIPL